MNAEHYPTTLAQPTQDEQRHWWNPAYGQSLPALGPTGMDIDGDGSRKRKTQELSRRTEKEEPQAKRNCFEIQSPCEDTLFDVPEVPFDTSRGPVCVESFAPTDGGIHRGPRNAQGFDQTSARLREVVAQCELQGFKVSGPWPISRKLSELPQSDGCEGILREGGQFPYEPRYEYLTEAECVDGGTYFGEGPVPPSCFTAPGTDPTRGNATYDQRRNDHSRSSGSDEEASDDSPQFGHLSDSDDLEEGIFISVNGSDWVRQDSSGEGSPSECFDD
jgi:hypothetical protein